MSKDQMSKDKKGNQAAKGQNENPRRRKSDGNDEQSRQGDRSRPISSMIGAGSATSATASKHSREIGAPSKRGIRTRILVVPCG
jgi:hypothetical protein